jgi:protein RecA
MTTSYTPLLERLAKKGIRAVPSSGYMPIDRWPTGSLMLDAALGGGLPKGRIVTIAGHEYSGKTTLSLVIAGTIIRAGGRVAYIDSEGTMSLDWAYRLGCTDLDRLLLIQPDNGEQALNAAKEIITAAPEINPETGEVTPLFDLIVLDSTGALVAEEETEMDAQDTGVAMMARKLAVWSRTMSVEAKRTGTTILAINHLLTKIGASKYERQWTESGGRKLQYLRSIGIELLSERVIEDSDEIAAHIFRGKVYKNKTAPPRKRFEVEVKVLNHNFGLDVRAELSGWSASEPGRTAAHSGLLKEFGILTNADGAPYSAGKMYFGGEPVTYPVKDGEAQHANSKATLRIALNNPAFRALAIKAVYQAIREANSHEAIARQIAESGSAWVDFTALMENDEDLALREALDAMTDDERQEALQTFAANLKEDPNHEGAHEGAENHAALAHD